MNDITKFLVISGTHFLLISFNIIHIKATIENRINGKIESKNSLKIELDSKVPVMLVSEMKQSNDKNALLGSPIVTIGLNELTSPSGKLSSNDSQAVINCK